MRYAGHISGVGAAFYTTARVNAVRFVGVGVGVMLYTTARVNPARFTAVGVGVMLLILLLLVPLFTLRLVSNGRGMKKGTQGSLLAWSSFSSFG